MKTTVFVAGIGLPFGAVGGSLACAADTSGQEPGHPSGKVITALSTAESLAPILSSIVFALDEYQLEPPPPATISRSS
jgi:hypothetical protein